MPYKNMNQGEFGQFFFLKNFKVYHEKSAIDKPFSETYCWPDRERCFSKVLPPTHASAASEGEKSSEFPAQETNSPP